MKLVGYIDSFVRYPLILIFVFIPILVYSSQSDLIYSTYLGGSSDDRGLGIDVDNNGNMYILGETRSNDFPVTSGSFDTTFNSQGSSNIFVTKISADGNTLLYSTYIGGSGFTQIGNIVVDSNGNTYITGQSYNTDFPVTPGTFDTTQNGQDDGFVTKLNSSGSNLIYSTFLGGSGRDFGYDLVVDASGNVYLMGGTSSPDFPTTSNAFDTSYNGVTDRFVTKLNFAGTGLIYSTYLGGSDSDIGRGIAIDINGNAYVSGYTLSSDFPVTPNAFDTSYSGNWDGFVSKLNPSGSSLVYSTYFGGTGDELVRGITLDNRTSVFITGYTTSTEFPVTIGAFDTSFNGNGDGFVTKFNAEGSALLYSTYLGGSQEDSCYGGIHIADFGDVWIAGHTYSSDFPISEYAYDSIHNGYTDLFITKFNGIGSKLYYSSLLGGTDLEFSNGLSVDDNNNVYVTGFTLSSNFPLTSNAIDITHTGGVEAFVFKLQPIQTQSPTDLSIEVISNTQLRLIWSDNSDNENGFGIDVKVGNGNWSVLSYVGANITTFNHNGLIQGQNYCYRVYSYNTAGLSKYSNEACAIPGTSTPPSHLIASLINDTDIQINWLDNSNNELGFGIDYKINNGPWSVLTFVDSNVTTHTHTISSPGTEYCYRVYAWNNIGLSGYSNEFCIFTSIPSTSVPEKEWMIFPD